MAESGYDVRSELLTQLLSKVQAEQYPSTTMLDTIEELLTPDDLPRYARVLMSKVSDERFPSVPMLARLRGLAVDPATGR